MSAGSATGIAVVIDDGYADYGIERAALAPFGLSLEVRPCRGRPEAVPEAVRGARAVFVRESPLTAQALAGLAPGAAVVRYGVGVDAIDLAAAARLGVVVANVPDYGVEEVSDHALALLMAVTRRLPQADAALRAGRWGAPRPATRRLAGLTLGIVGFGRIGQAFARKCAGLGFARILVSDPRAALPVGLEAASLDDLLARADAVSLHLPMNAANASLLSRARLFAMKPGAVLINTARGGLVDEAGLIAALEAGHLSGAGLDVFGTEPLGADHPLAARPDVVLTDHYGWASPQAEAELQQKAAAEIARILSGTRPIHWVNAPPAYDWPAPPFPIADPDC